MFGFFENNKTNTDFRNKYYELKEKFDELSETTIGDLEDKIKDLKLENERLTNKNRELIDSKDAARKELESEFKDRIDSVENFYVSKIDSINDLHEKELSMIRKNHSDEITNLKTQFENNLESAISIRVNELSGEIKGENEVLKLKLSVTENALSDYKERFDNGKVQLSAVELKGMLLAANPNGTHLLEAMKNI